MIVQIAQLSACGTAAQQSNNVWGGSNKWSFIFLHFAKIAGTHPLKSLTKNASENHKYHSELQELDQSPLSDDITARNTSKSPEICIATRLRIIYVSPCLCVCEGWVGAWRGGRGAHTSAARVFVRKSCVTICRRLPPRQHARLKLIVNCLLLAKAWAEGAQGHSQGLATISDGLGRGGAGEGGGGLCVTAQLLRHVFWVTDASSLLQNITSITFNARVCPSIWMNSAAAALIWV